MGKLYYVDNTLGNDSYNGLTKTYPFLTIDKAIDMINSYGRPGDGIRIAYTGQDYTYVANSSITTTGEAGYGWGDGEYYTIQGYDPDNGYNRPKLMGPGDPTAGSVFAFTTDANYWELSELDFEFTTANTSWSAYFILIGSGLNDAETHWRFYKCRFTGKCTISTYHDQGVFVSSGTRAFLEYKYCFFEDLYYPIRGYTALPAPHSSVCHYCIFYFNYLSGSVQFTFNTDATNSDFTTGNQSYIDCTKAL